LAIEGTYQCDVKTAFGVFAVKMKFSPNGEAINVDCSTQWGDKSVSGQLKGPDTVVFSARVNSPMGPVTLDVNAVVKGDELSGKVKAGLFGNASIKGKKIS